MILVDTSVWIEFLSGRFRAVRQEDLVRFVTCGPVVQEVLQGLRAIPESAEFRKAFLALPVLAHPTPLGLYLSAAEIYRQGRRRGMTIRSSVDCLIAAIAIECGVPVCHRDRDFKAIAEYTTLEVIEMSQLGGSPLH
jgi:predicted nucleic acid-binding protein